jgi:hypothetical protein
MQTDNLDPIRLLRQKSQDPSLEIEAVRKIWSAVHYLDVDTKERIARWIEGRL